MNIITDTLSVTWKEIQLIVRDRGSLMLFLLLPLLLGVVMGAANIASNPEEEATILLHVGLVNQDSGAFGTEVAKAIADIDELDVRELDATEAEEQVSQGDLAAAIIIPPNFSQNIDAHTPSTVDVIVDPGQPESVSIVSGIMKQVVAEVTIWGEVQYGVRTILGETAPEGLTEAQMRAAAAQTTGVIMTALNEMRTTPVISVNTEDVTGAVAALTVQQFVSQLFAGFAVMFIFLTVSWSATSLLVERETGTLRRLLSAPISRGSIIAGKMLAFVLLSCVQVVLLFGVAAGFFHAPLGQAPLALVIMTLVVGLTSAAVGMLVAALARTSGQAGNIGVILGLVLAGIGGSIPMAAGPVVRQAGFAGTLASLTPQGHAINGFYKVMAEGAGLVDILPQLGILVGVMVVAFVLATWRFRFQD